MHFLCMSWCRTGGNRNLGEPGLSGGEPRPTLPGGSFELFEFVCLLKQQSSERKNPRRGFLPTWPGINQNLWGSYGSDYEDYCFYDAMRYSLAKRSWYWHFGGNCASIFRVGEDGGGRFLRHVSTFLPDYKVSQPKDQSAIMISEFYLRKKSWCKLHLHLFVELTIQNT